MAQVILEPLLQNVGRVSGQIPSSPSRGLTSRLVCFKLYRSMMIAVLVLVVDCIVAIGGRMGWRRVIVLRLLVLRVWYVMGAGSAVAVVPITVITSAVIPIT